MIDPFWHTIFQTSSAYNPDIKVVQHGKMRKLLVQGYTQSKSLEESGQSGGYWDAFVSEEIKTLNPGRALVLGLGAGTIIELWSTVLPDLRVDVVEIDPVIVEVTREYFQLPESTKIIVGSASKTIRSLGQTYDLIVVDVYRGGDFDLSCESNEFLYDIKQILNKNGMVMFNRIYGSSEKDLQRSFTDRLEKSFTNVKVSRPKPELPSYNVIISATKV